MQNFGQTTRTISGFVCDSESGEALVGASVVLKGTRLGAVTNASGFFSIPDVSSGKKTIRVSFMGYDSRSMELSMTASTGNLRLERILLNPSSVSTRAVIVRGDSARTIEKLYSKPISNIELTGQQINNIPRVVEADLLRSLQTMPGIVPLSDFSSALYVRGGTPDQNLYLIDGTDVYNPEHAFGLFSTFNTSAIKKVSLSKGGFGAEYGGRLSSVLDVTNIDGNRNHFKAELNVSLLSASATIQMPIGSIGSLSASFRRTYFDKTIAKFSDDIPNYYFYDGNLKAYFDLGERDKLTFSYYGGRDKLHYIFDKKSTDQVGFDYDWGNATTSLNWKRVLSDRLFSNFWITGSWFSSNFDFQELHSSEKNKINDLTFKWSMEYYYSKEFTFKAGIEEKNLYGMLKDEFSSGRVDVSQYKRDYSAYTTLAYRPSDKFDIEGGLRYDYFDSDTDYKNFDPRFSVKYRLSETSSLKFSTGKYSQYMQRLPRAFIASIWTAADKYTSGSTAYHFILGYQKEIAQIYALEIEAYYKKYRNIYSYNQNMLTTIEPGYYDSDHKPVYSSTQGLFNRGDGNSKGVEFLLRKDYGAVTGWVGYSLSRTEYKVDGVNGGSVFVPRHDRTSTVNAVANIDIRDFFNEISDHDDFAVYSSKWTLGLNFVYSSGQPITLPTSAYATSSMPGWALKLDNYPSEVDNMRLPYYARIDLSVNYQKNYGAWSLLAYFQVFNLGNRKNVWFINYEFNTKDNLMVPDITNYHMLPILPSIGFTIKF